MVAAGSRQRVRYRVLQGLRAFWERPDAQTRQLARSYLSEEGLQLFESLSPRDQFHSARTASILITKGVSDPELLQSALLHDVGKGRQSLWQRAAYVLLAWISPALLKRVARPGAGWRGALDRSRRHAVLGAQLAAAAGYSRRVVCLVARHHDKPAAEDEAALQSADERA